MENVFMELKDVREKQYQVSINLLNLIDKRITELNETRLEGYENKITTLSEAIKNLNI